MLASELVEKLGLVTVGWWVVRMMSQGRSEKANPPLRTYYVSPSVTLWYCIKWYDASL